MFEKEGKSVKLYAVEKGVTCLKCGNKGAVQAYGRFYPHGMGYKYKYDETFMMYWNKPHLFPMVGFGGTVPHECLNCGNVGLIDFGGLECYEQAFESIKEGKEE